MYVMYSCIAYIIEEGAMAGSPVGLHDQPSGLSRALRPVSYWLVHCSPLNLFLKFIMYSYRFSPNMQIYLLRFCAAESMIPIFRQFSSTGQLSKSCTSLASFLLSIKSMQIWSVNLVLPWCNLLPLICPFFAFLNSLSGRKFVGRE